MAPPVLIIDNGASTIKAGFAHSDLEPLCDTLSRKVILSNGNVR